MRTYISYQLEIHVERTLRLQIGRFGTHQFPAGRYLYTGSARRNFEARLARHLRQEKSLRWHIDWLLTAPGVSVTRVRRSTLNECQLNRSAGGNIIVPGFGASDCRAGCGSHLRYLGSA